MYEPVRIDRSSDRVYDADFRVLRTFFFRTNRVICSYTENFFYWELSNMMSSEINFRHKIVGSKNRRLRQEMYENMQNIKPYRDHDFVFIFSPHFFWFTDLNERKNILKHNFASRYAWVNWEQNKLATRKYFLSKQWIKKTIGSCVTFQPMTDDAPNMSFIDNVTVNFQYSDIQSHLTKTSTQTDFS